MVDYRRGKKRKMTRTAQEGSMKSLELLFRVCWKEFWPGGSGQQKAGQLWVSGEWT